MQRILIYGFGPYQQYTSNITEVLLREYETAAECLQRSV